MCPKTRRYTVFSIKIAARIPHQTCFQSIASNFCVRRANQVFFAPMESVQHKLSHAHTAVQRLSVWLPNDCVPSCTILTVSYLTEQHLLHHLTRKVIDVSPGNFHRQLVLNKALHWCRAFDMYSFVQGLPPGLAAGTFIRVLYVHPLAAGAQ